MSTPAPPNKIVVLAMTVIAVCAMGATTVLIMSGKSVGDLLAVLAVAAVPVLSYFGAQIHGTVNATKELANGNNSALRDALISIATQTPPPAVPPAPPTPPPA